MGLVRIDSGMMRQAVSSCSDEPGVAGRGFLNRATGEIVFVFDEAQLTGFGAGTVAEVARNKARVQASPEQWVEIPTMSRPPVFHEHWCEVRCRNDLLRQERSCTCGVGRNLGLAGQDEDTFLREFLAENEIEAVLQ